MSTWHQQQAMKRGFIRLYHPTQWTVVIDPPNQMMALIRFNTKALADVYLRNLEANNPGAYQHSHVLRPRKA